MILIYYRQQRRACGICVSSSETRNFITSMSSAAEIGLGITETHVSSQTGPYCLEAWACLGTGQLLFYQGQMVQLMPWASDFSQPPGADRNDAILLNPAPRRLNITLSLTRSRCGASSRQALSSGEAAGDCIAFGNSPKATKELGIFCFSWQPRVVGNSMPPMCCTLNLSLFFHGQYHAQPLPISWSSRRTVDGGNLTREFSLHHL